MISEHRAPLLTTLGGIPKDNNHFMTKDATVFEAVLKQRHALTWLSSSEPPRISAAVPPIKERINRVACQQEQLG